MAINILRKTTHLIVNEKRIAGYQEKKANEQNKVWVVTELFIQACVNAGLQLPEYQFLPRRIDESTVKKLAK